LEAKSEIGGKNRENRIGKNLYNNYVKKCFLGLKDKNFGLKDKIDYFPV